jgi:murein DD-endopeptidase MepM/ murein hydrolase activator NlpD
VVIAPWVEDGPGYEVCPIHKFNIAPHRLPPPVDAALRKLTASKPLRSNRRQRASHAAVLSIALVSAVFLGGRIGSSVVPVDSEQLTVSDAYFVPLPPEGFVAAAAAEPAAPTPEPVMYTTHQVTEGDTLSSIAEQHGITTEYLIWNNPLVAADPDMLLIGEEVMVPSTAGIVYDVRLGDTISDIAATYSVDPTAIIAYGPNKLDTPDLIIEGMVLMLPGAVPPAPPPPEPVAVEEAPAAEPAGAPTLDTPSAPVLVREQPAAPPVSAGFIWPVNGRLNSSFGPRWGSVHQGIDIGAGSGTGVMAAGSGQVVLAKYGTGYGNYIIVRHGNGLETLYAHLSGIYVGLGQYVGQGEIIGAVGCTGWCSGPHLHFEVHAGGPVNPLNYLP